MTDMVNGLTQGQNTSQTPEISAPPAPSQEQSASQAPAQTKAERTFKQADVDNIVKKVKHEAVESYRRMQVEQPDYLANKYGDKPPAPGMTPDDVRRLAAEETERLKSVWINEAQTKQQEQEANRVAQEFFNKLGTGKEKYNDFENIVGDIDYVRFPNAIQLANSFVDNTVDVMYELGKDRI